MWKLVMKKNISFKDKNENIHTSKNLNLNQLNDLKKILRSVK